MNYIKKSNLEKHINGRTYSAIHYTGSVRGMKQLYGWDKATEIFRCGQYIYALFD